MDRLQSVRLVSCSIESLEETVATATQEQGYFKLGEQNGGREEHFQSTSEVLKGQHSLQLGSINHGTVGIPLVGI